FGSTLNIAASLANPALPAMGVRGVYSREMILPVAQVMEEIGYRSAIVLHGCVGNTGKGMDEASVCGTTHCARIRTRNGQTEIEEFSFDPQSLGLACPSGEELRPEADKEAEARRFARLITNGETGPRRDAVLLNAALIFLAADQVDSLEQGMEKAAGLLESGKAFETLENWVAAQNREPEKGLATLHALI
ncbi:MAG: anthranilate phosphoribosyltransferase, partial [Desulfobacterales bacterium]|nr:anthranilate phosphoribosyltransferase [Desulfobacterales bacterium]